ncbi:flagellar biosynthesis anti-sigma factor FlgM [Methylovorus sp. MM2]|uniref:flagellar biosynthesis anti-sigma factor FlgM n=1 Tax=Methylovorus sp. MM2 TaxID=1848038 RepID=UPI0007E02DE1|nr:flagellar biosynthesis anti-sigma factor FlgM [Methylovorus sp. MM2]OAM51350.1 flagellar biosynthesis anti-sigma factor FlgM [Methylovorus sp. MM2]
MKINDSVSKAASLTVEKPETSTTSKSVVAPVSSSSGSAESVTLSPLSSQLQSLEAKVATSSVFDAEKVDAIKSAISSGQFTVNSEKVADGLINSVKDLLVTN